MQIIVIIMVDYYSNDYDLVGNTKIKIITMLVLIYIIEYLNDCFTQLLRIRACLKLSSH